MRSTIRKAVYLSGPMTGIEDYNYPAFHEAARTLRAAGYAVINPAESYDGDQSLPFDMYMRHDLTQILGACDAIVVLPGWEDSAGAVLEVAVGVGLGYGILKYAPDATLMAAFPLHETHRERLGWVLGVGLNPIVTGDELENLAELKALEAEKAYAKLEDAGLISKGFRPAGPEPMTTWAEADNGLLKAADHIVNGDRQRTYGHPIDHHTTTAELWQAYLTRVNSSVTLVRPQDVSILMVLDKVSRIGGGDKVDNVLDIAGYAQVHAKVRAKQVAE